MTDTNKTLRVYLHGPIALFVYPDRLEAHIPDIGSEHTYCYGDWLVEYPIVPGVRLSLQGILYDPPEPGEPVIGKDTLVFDGFRPQPEDYTGRYATFVLPVPNCIDARQTLTYDPDHYYGSHKPSNKRKASSLHVLTYCDVTDFGNIRLGAWNAATVHTGDPQPDRNQSKLYIFADAQLSDKDVPRDSRLRAVNRCFKLAQDLDIEMVDDPGMVSGMNRDEPTPLDEWDLAVRTEMLAPIAAIVASFQPGTELKFKIQKKQSLLRNQPACGHGYVATVT